MPIQYKKLVPDRELILLVDYADYETNPYGLVLAPVGMDLRTASSIVQDVEDETRGMRRHSKNRVSGDRVMELLQGLGFDVIDYS